MIYVLGATGMLGRYVYTYLKQANMEVTKVTRKKLDAKHPTKLQLSNLGLATGDVVINCMGLIPQRNTYNTLDFILVNAVFPHVMADYCEGAGAKFIHVSTDCVFDGLGGGYNEEALHDASTIYGKTKSLGEPQKATCIRTSIIGEELKNKKSLLEWVRSNRGKTINGYTNHWWNGITCLQFAKVCEELIITNNYWEGVRHIISPTIYRKSALVNLISDIYDLNITIMLVRAVNYCDRTLATIKPMDIKIPTLKQQIKEMHEYHTILGSEVYE